MPMESDDTTKRPPSPTRTCSCVRVKRWTTLVTIACFFLAGGIEYSVILPTMWDYLRGMGGPEWMYGLTLSAFSISNLLAGPIYGLVFDVTHQTKLIVLFANLFEIGGNFMYFSATSKYMIVGSRFIVGLGAGAGATLFGELARISTKKERTKVFSLFTTFRQLGLICGPAFNLFLRKLNIDIGPFKLDKLTAPGAVMTVVWVSLEVLFLFFFYQLPSAIEPAEENDSDDTKSGSDARHSSVTSGGAVEKEGKTDCKNDFHKQSKVGKKCSKSAVCIDASTGESTPLLRDEQKTDGHSLNRDTERSSSSSLESQSPQTTRGRLARARDYVVSVASHMVLEEIVVLLALLFLTVFSQTAIETMLVPMAETLLDWTERDISIFFSCAGLELIVGIAVVYIVSRWIGDRWQLLVGLTFNIFGYAWMLGWTGSGRRDIPGLLWKFIFGAMPIIFGLPFFYVTGASLYSKLLPMQVQGNQGLDGNPFWSAHQYGIQVFSLSTDQICSLLQDHEPTKGVDILKLGTTPIAQYQASGGGRLYPIITREEISKVMQGVDVMLMMLTTQPDMFDFIGGEFYECLLQENLLQQCKAVAVRIVRSTQADVMSGRYAPKHMAADEILARYGLNTAKTIKDKLYILADKEVKQTSSRGRWKGKKGKKGKVDGDMTLTLAQLRAHLLGEEMKEVVMAPVKETVSAGKALIGIGQRFSSWVASLVKS